MNQDAVLRLLLRTPGPVVRALCGGRIRVDGQELDPASQLLNHFTVARRRPIDASVSPERARAALSKLTDRLAPADPRWVRDRQIQGPGGALGVREYRPPGLPEAAPALVYFHGGGWVMGGLTQCDSMLLSIARRVGCVVLSVDYRLAPEDPYPAALDDGEAAFRWARSEAAALGVDRERLAVGGDSAGGNLAAALCLRLRGEAGAPIHQLLVYPIVDLTKESASYALFAEGFFLTRALMRWFIGHYVADPARREAPTVSPLLADGLEGLPPAHVVLAGFDPLRDEGRAYAARLADAGVSVRLDEYPTTFHGFFGMGAFLPIAADANEAAAEALRQAFGV